MKQWVVIYVLSCVASVAGILGVLWALSGFQSLGIGTDGMIALVGGIVLTVGLGVGLMALVFASNRGTTDEEVHRSQIGGPDQP